jgi:glycerol uptake operon antiterminator
MTGRADLLRRLTEFPCGAAVKLRDTRGDDLHDDLDAALDGRPGVLFVLRGNGLELAPIVHRIHAAGKLVAVHLDLVDGLSTDAAGVRWLVRCGVDAIISSQSQAVSSARAEGVVAIQRVLCSTRSALELGLAAVSRANPAIVELLPGVILPEVADLVLPRLAVPLLAGGFIRDAADVRSVLAAGALAVTTSEPALWN